MIVDRTLLYVDEKEQDTANEAAVVIWGPYASDAFGEPYSNKENKELTHYVGMFPTSDELAEFIALSQIADLISNNKLVYYPKTKRSKLAEDGLEKIKTKD